MMSAVRQARQSIPLGMMITLKGQGSARVAGHNAVPAVAAYGNADGSFFDLFVELLGNRGQITGRTTIRCTVTDALALVQKRMS